MTHLGPGLEKCLPSGANTIMFNILKHEPSLCTSANTPKYAHGVSSKQPLWRDTYSYLLSAAIPRVSRRKEHTFMASILSLSLLALLMNASLLRWWLSSISLSCCCTAKHTNPCNRLTQAVREKALELEFELVSLNLKKKNIVTEWAFISFRIDVGWTAFLVCGCVLVSLLQMSHVLHHTKSYKREWRLNFSQSPHGNIHLG